MHFTSTVWIFPFQASAGLFPERRRGEERFRLLFPSFALSTELPDIWIPIQVRRNKAASSLTLSKAAKLDKRNSFSLVIWASGFLSDDLTLREQVWNIKLWLQPSVMLTFCVLQLINYGFIADALYEWCSWQAAKHTNIVRTKSDSKHDKKLADPSEEHILFHTDM